MSNTEKKNTFYGGAVVLAVGSIIVKLIGALYKIPLGNILSNESYTNFNTAYSVYNLFLMISTAGLPVALSKTISEASTLGRRNQINRIFRVAMTTFTVLGVLTFLVMSLFGSQLAVMMGDDSAVYCIWALAPSALCVCIMSAFRGYYQGHGNMVPTAISQIIEALFKLIIGLALAYMVLQVVTGGKAQAQRLAAAGAIFGVSIGSIVGLVFLIVRFSRDRRKDAGNVSHEIPDASRDIFSRLIKLAIPITLGSAAISIVTIIDTKVVLSLLRKMYEDLPELVSAEALAQANEAGGVSPALFMAQGLKGIYDKCMAIYNLPSQLMVAITASVIPAVSACLAKKDRLAASRTSESALHIGVMLALPMGIGIWSLAAPIVDLLFPGKMSLDVAGPIMAVLGVASIFVCIMLICNSILQAYGLVNLPVITVVIGGIIKIVVNYILVGNYEINIKGAPVGTLCCFAAVAILDLIIIKIRVPDAPKYTRVFVKPVIASLVMGAAAWGSHGLMVNYLGLSSRLAVVGAIVIAVVVYAVLVLAMRILSKEDLALMPKGDKIAKILHIH